MHFSSSFVKKIALLWIVFIGNPAFAARPFVTDDARLATAESCQLETWSRLYKNSTEFWALPACNLSGNFEITAGKGLALPRDTASTQDYVIQAKSLVRELTTNGWGWGIAIGRVSHPSITPGPNLLGNTYAYVPVSVSTLQDRVIYHLNIGWLRDNATQENRSTYGIGAEIQATSKLLWIAETFGDHKSSPYWQTGFRYSIIPNLFQVDTTIGNQMNGNVNTQWISFGIRYTPSSIF
ncbi:MAG: hypothetical protein KGP13_06350 [Burkholderiales bacterium]|nr:hypothetical protein [Burkholderiales bacterium]